MTTGCPQREGDTALPVRWETPVVEIFQPGAISYLFTKKWRGKLWGRGRRARSIAPCCVLCPQPSPTSAGWQKRYQGAVALVQGAITHLAETCRA